MFMTNSEYDGGVNTFSPEGRLFQVEYAIEATKLGSTSIGIKTKHGVVLVVEKRINTPLLVPSSVEKIFKIDEFNAVAVSGLVADARILVERARVESANHWFNYNSRMSVENIAQSVSKMALSFSDNDDDRPAMSRPFGVALLFAGVDMDGPQLIHMDPSGTFINYHAKAIGSGSEGAQQSLVDTYNQNMTIEESAMEILAVLKNAMEEKLTSCNVEMCSITEDGKFHLYTKPEIEELILKKFSN